MGCVEWIAHNGILPNHYRWLLIRVFVGLAAGERTLYRYPAA